MSLTAYSGLRPSNVISKYGRCLELVPVDKNFHDISVGLYLKGNICTVWTFSTLDGVDNRVEKIRNQLVVLGGMSPVKGTTNQAQFDCGEVHIRPLRFLMSQAVGKSADYAPATELMSIKDTKSDLTIHVTPSNRDGARVYSISVSGEAKNPSMRLRMIVAGFSKYGDMDKLGDNEVAFACRGSHDELMRLLMPYSRNISSVETMMAAEDMRGQMNTSTLGFSQT